MLLGEKGNKHWKVCVFLFVHMCDSSRPQADGFIETCLCIPAARVLSCSDCSYRRGTFVFSLQLWGRQADSRALYSQSLKNRMGLVLHSFTLLFLWLWGRNKRNC